MLGTFTAWGPSYVNEMLKFEATAATVDFVGVTAYFGVDVSIDSTFASGKTVDSVFNLLQASAAAFPGNTQLPAIKAAAAARGVGIVT